MVYTVHELCTPRCPARSRSQRVRGHFGSNHSFCSNVRVIFLRRELFWFGLVQVSATHFCRFPPSMAHTDDAPNRPVPISSVQYTSSNFGSFSGSGLNIDDMPNIYTLRGAARANSCSLELDVPNGITRHKYIGRIRGSTHSDGTEFQRSQRTYVQVRNRWLSPHVLPRAEPSSFPSLQLSMTMVSF